MVYITDLDNPNMYGYGGQGGYGGYGGYEDFNRDYRYRTKRRPIFRRAYADGGGFNECGPNVLPVAIGLIIFLSEYRATFLNWCSFYTVLRLIFLARHWHRRGFSLISWVLT